MCATVRSIPYLWANLRQGGSAGSDNSKTVYESEKIAPLGKKNRVANLPKGTSYGRPLPAASLLVQFRSTSYDFIRQQAVRFRTSAGVADFFYNALRIGSGIFFSSFFFDSVDFNC